MGFTLYHEETGRRAHYEFHRGEAEVIFGRRDLESMFFGTELANAPNLARVSRKHFRITSNGYDCYFLFDTSKNGTCMNGEMIGEGLGQLGHGDLIRLGSENMPEAISLYFLEDGKKTKLIKPLSDEPTQEYRLEDKSRVGQE